ncbi:MAG: hypothetical protein HUJ30_09395, partial [Gammaproteobacteria bacterium]|nr:hypothetical protein [Gammaproteobacteria bacterium]
MPIRQQITQGMALQLENRRDALLAGQTHLGWKLGFNDPAARERCQLPSPIAGYLTHSTLLAQNSSYQADENASILLEAELAIQITQDVDQPIDQHDAEGLISAVAPAIELVDMSAGMDD